LETASDLLAVANRFRFMQGTNSSFNLKLQKDWSEQGGKTFSFEVLEELKKGETQNDTEFKADIELLKEIWLEKLNGKAFY